MRIRNNSNLYWGPIVSDTVYVVGGLLLCGSRADDVTEPTTVVGGATHAVDHHLSSVDGDGRALRGRHSSVPGRPDHRLEPVAQRVGGRRDPVAHLSVGHVTRDDVTDVDEPVSGEHDESAAPDEGVGGRRGRGGVQRRGRAAAAAVELGRRGVDVGGVRAHLRREESRPVAVVVVQRRGADVAGR